MEPQPVHLLNSDLIGFALVESGAPWFQSSVLFCCCVACDQSFPPLHHTVAEDVAVFGTGDTFPRSPLQKDGTASNRGKELDLCSLVAFPYRTIQCQHTGNVNIYNMCLCIHCILHFMKKRPQSQWDYPFKLRILIKIKVLHSSA